MTAAVVTVHARNGIWNTNQGYEFNVVLIAAVFALAGIGAGAWSLDNAFGFDLHGVIWAVAALAVGIIGGVGSVIWAGSGRHEPHRRLAATRRHVAKPGSYFPKISGS